MTQRRDGSPVQFRVLGPIEAVVNWLPVDVGPPQRRLLLGLLLLQPGEPVPVERLIDLTWEVPPPRARRAVFAHVARLRKALAGPDGPAVPLMTVQSGYALRIEPTTVDAHLFRAMVAEAYTVEDPVGRSKTLGAALDLWRGPVLEDLAVAPEARWLVRSLDELRLSAIEDRVDADLASGRHAAVIGELSRLVIEYPLRERMAAHLMVALYRCGAAANALEVYRRIRHQLVEELGLDPGPELTGLHEAILDRSLAPAPTGTAVLMPAPAPLGDPVTVPRQLPPAARGFTARAAELDQLDAWLVEAQRPGQPALVATVCGTAGIGKTTLAVQWAHRVAGRFPDGQLYVNLRGFDPTGSPVPLGEAVRGFLDALGVPAERIPAGTQAQVGLYRSLVAGRRVLIVLDNALDAGQIRPLLPGSPGCAALVTSRDQLADLVTTEGARPLGLALLTGEEARHLLAGRLGANRVAGEPDAVHALVERCARLPLALSIVAARAAIHPGFPLAALVADLGTEPNAADPHDLHPQVYAVFSWSYRRLDPAAARLFGMLGLHPGPDVTAAAAASLTGTPADRTRSALGELCRAHLIDEPVPGRYTFHDLLRAYARRQAQLRETETDRRRAQHRVLDHYLHTAHAASRLLNPHRQPIDPVPALEGVVAEPLADAGQALVWFTAEHRVLTKAIAAAGADGFPAHAWQLAWTCTTYFERHGHWADLAVAHRTALRAAVQTGDRAGQANAHYGLGRADARLGERERAATEFRLALDLFGELGDQTRGARTHLGLAWVLDLQDRPSASLDHARQALELARAGDNRSLQANALNAIGWYHARLGDGAPALRHCGQALVLQQELGDRNGQATTWDSLGYAHHLLGDHPAAVGCYRQALNLYRELGDRYNEADTLCHLADAYHAYGATAAARATWQLALDVLVRLGHPRAETVRKRLDSPTG